jgi:hypothetical protein
VCGALTSAATRLRFVKLETREKPFDLFQLAMGLGRVVENTNIWQNQTAKLQKYLQILSNRRFVAKRRVSLFFLDCQFSVDQDLESQLCNKKN